MADYLKYKDKPLSVLAVQSLVVDEIGTYMDYRDYLLSINSNPALVNSPIRINIENSETVVDYFNSSLKKNGFTNYNITSVKPPSWSSWITRQMEDAKTDWVMPFPGDHIYLHSESDAFCQAIQKGEELSADAIAYGHVYDFEHFLDWRRIKVLYVDDEYILFSWGGKWKGYHNRTFQVNTQRIVSKCLTMPEVVGFCIYSSTLMKKILSSMPSNNSRWHEMEKVSIPDTVDYKILIPRKLLYYHVHSYWLSLYSGCKRSGIKIGNGDNFNALKALYIPTEFNWERTPANIAVENYKKRVVDRFPEMDDVLAGNTFRNVGTDTGFRIQRKISNTFQIAISIIHSKVYFFFLVLQKKLRDSIAMLKTRLHAIINT